MYIPIIKNRTIEISVLNNLIKAGLSNKTIPLIEIIQLKSRSNSSKTYVEELEEIFKENKHPFILDIPKITLTSSTSKSIKEFMTLVNRKEGFVLDQINSCKHIQGIIPTISFNIKIIPTKSLLKENFASLRKNFTKIALRITPTQFNKLGDFVFEFLEEDDLFILDIDNNGHTNPVFKKIYRKICATCKSKKFLSFLINSNRPEKFYNKNIIDGEPIEEIDNSLLEMYNQPSYGQFNGFGDYACITNTLPSTGGTISPAGIYYSKEGNFFVGYKGRSPSLSEFNNYITPAIIKSEYWNEFNEEHHLNCPGCKKIKEIFDGASGKSQGMWKGITMNHYIYTIDQILNS